MASYFLIVYRAKGGKFGFAESVTRNKLTTNEKSTEHIDTEAVEKQMKSERVEISDSDRDSDVMSSEYPFIISTTP